MPIEWANEQTWMDETSDSRLEEGDRPVFLGGWLRRRRARKALRSHRGDSGIRPDHPRGTARLAQFDSTGGDPRRAGLPGQWADRCRRGRRWRRAATRLDSSRACTGRPARRVGHRRAAAPASEDTGRAVSKHPQRIRARQPGRRPLQSTTARQAFHAAGSAADAAWELRFRLLEAEILLGQRNNQKSRAAHRRPCVPAAGRPRDQAESALAAGPTIISAGRKSRIRNCAKRAGWPNRPIPR